MGITVANTLYNRGNKIIREGEIGTVEIRFYSSETPNEKYRIGQKKLIGKVTTIEKVSSGFSFTFDLSEQYFGKTNTFTINKIYIDACYIRCIVFDITNTVNDIEEKRSYTISAEEWLSSNTYLNKGIIDTSTEQWAYEEDQYVEVKATILDEVIEGIARIANIVNTGDIDSNGNIVFRVTLDFSGKFSYRVVDVLTYNIEYIKKYEVPPTEDENWDGQS